MFHGHILLFVVQCFFLHKRLTFRAIVKYVDEIPNVRFMKVVFSRATHRA